MLCDVSSSEQRKRNMKVLSNMLINMASVTYVLCVVEPMCSQAVQAQTLLDTLLFGRSQMDRADFWYGASDRPWGGGSTQKWSLDLPKLGKFLRKKIYSLQ